MRRNLSLWSKVCCVGVFTFVAMQSLCGQDAPVSELESGYLKNVRQVTSSFVKAGEGYFSPDGKQLMWTSTRTDTHTSQLFIADFILPKK